MAKANHFYVCISENCQNEAKRYNLVEQLDKSKDRVEQLGDLTQFELFELPYYVKKNFAYQYRLLVYIKKMTEIDGIVVVFLKIYARGDKSYENLYINARKYGNSIFKQIGAGQELDRFIQAVQQQNIEQPVLEKKEKECPYIALLSQYRADFFNFNQQIYEYYWELPHWRYEVSSKLSSQQLGDYYQGIYQALEQQRTVQFTVEGKDNSKLYVAGQEFDKNKPLLPVLYHKNVYCEMENVPYYLGNKVSQDELLRNFRYGRKVPLEFLVDNEHVWKNIQQFDLPFELNAFQQVGAKRLFVEQSAFPLVMRGEANTGKTTFLAVLYSQYQFVQRIEDKEVLPCLFLCQAHEKADLHQQIHQYVKFRQSWQDLPQHDESLSQADLNRSCLSFNEYLLSHLNDEQRLLFRTQNYIDRDRFLDLYQQQFKDNSGGFLAWDVLQYIIKGRGINTDQRYEGLRLENESLLSRADLDFIYEQVFKGWYRPLVEKYYYWDDQDLISYIEKNEIALRSYMTLLVDESQRLSEKAIQLLLKQMVWLKYSWVDSVHQVPMVFACTPESQEHLCSFTRKLERQLKNISYVLQFQEDKVLQPELTVVDAIEYLPQSAIGQCCYQYRKGISLSQLDDCQALYFTLDDVNADPEEFIDYIDINNEDYIPMLQQHHLPLLLNTLGKEAVESLQQQTAFSAFVINKKVQEFRPFLTLTQLSKKVEGIILFGFTCVLNDILRIWERISQGETVSFQEQYALDYRLYVLQQALQQGVIQRYVLEDSLDHDTYQAWTTFLAPSTVRMRAMPMVDVVPYKLIHRTTLDFKYISPHFDKLLSILDSHQEGDDVSERLHAQSLICKSRFNLNGYMRYTTAWYFINQQYDVYFQLYGEYPLNDDMFYLMWYYHKNELLRQYQHYFSEQVQSYLTLVEWVDGIVQENHLKEYHRLMTAWQHEPDQRVIQSTWFKPYFEQLNRTLLTRIRQNTWSLAGFKQLNRLIQSGNAIQNLISDDFRAFVQFGLHHYDEAILLWEQAIQTQQLSTYPIEYHQAHLQHCSDSMQRLAYLLSINYSPLFTMELLKMNLNELQTDYWHKICQYLEQQDELQEVLKDLLPSIDSPEVLEKLVIFCQSNPQNEYFARRVQRFKTLQACRQNDFSYVLERLKEHTPMSQERLQELFWEHAKLKVTREHHAKSKNKQQFQVNEEVVDILYALNLNPHFKVVTSVEELTDYQQDEIVNQIFEQIRKIFLLSDDDDDKGVWRTNFANVPALYHFLEKSPNLYDAYSLYAQMMMEGKSSTSLLERYMVMKTRIEQHGQSNEELIQDMQRLDTKLRVRSPKFKKLVTKMQEDMGSLELTIEPLKQISDLMKLILAMSNKENAEIQKLQREEAEKARLEAERIAQEEAEKARLEAERIAQEEAEKARLEAERIAQEEAEKARLEAERIAQEEAEKARLEAERIAQEEAEKARLEAERIAQEEAEKARLEAERIAQEEVEKARLEAERIAQEEAEKARLEAERIAQEEVEKARLEAERIAEEQVNSMNQTPILTQPSSIEPSTYQPQVNEVGLHHRTPPRKAITQFEFFDARIFIARLHKRINIEHLQTGERWSLNYETGQVQSDWLYQQHDQHYVLMELYFEVVVFKDEIHIHHQEHGVTLQLQL